jgi:hypothetical protein
MNDGCHELAFRAPVPIGAHAGSGPARAPEARVRMSA